jgi:hypothetical protein
MEIYDEEWLELEIKVRQLVRRHLPSIETEALTDDIMKAVQEALPKIVGEEE